ncbi:acyl-CoA dehydrogenase family protein [Nocardia sp. alder85J]|uniref:acyl-CoA dehydrogenase family protein n=1 Tax=Nocardia sp. alder85J TaxID=2862949 RepID=UPI001CD54F3B|nr:acyl-CoA dehydrogenase family protein [Nocardia sp. alder85J]MCX4098603.1 acyl-CoA dehydrogenase family protein [Nocardia sp. alder85J]
MNTLSVSELAAFSDSVDGVLGRIWPAATAAEHDTDRTLTDLWTTAAIQGWTALGADGVLDAAIAATGRLGRVACPLPLIDTYIALALLRDNPIAEHISDAIVRPLVVVAESGARTVHYAEAAGAASHVLVLADGDATLRPITGRATTPGLAAPAWSELTLGDETTALVSPGPQAIEKATATIRLGLVSRAVAAARRSLEHSIEHAKNRVAFGKPIGSFQAVSHRAADGATDLTAAGHLIDQAVAAVLDDRPDAILAIQLATAFAGPAAVRAQFGAQHTLAAQGYFEEHEAPWLFRRVNADVARLDSFRLAAGEASDTLIETGVSLPALALGPDAEAFRAEVRAFIGNFDHDVAVQHADDRGAEDIAAAASERGYLTMAWPASAGGSGASVERQTVFGEEFAYARLPMHGKAAIDLLGTAIVRHGTEEQKQRLLPLIARGDFPFYLGYSEPETGSDLAALRTRAVRDGDEWIVNGRKMWGTGAHTAEWVWLAARTDPDAKPPHAGITVFLTRIDRPGFELQCHRALSGETSCSTFFDDFRIPDADRVGEINGGWKVITTALAQERVLMANSAAEIHRLLDDLLDEVRKDPAGIAGARGSAQRATITDLAARLQAARVLVNASIKATSGGEGARLEAPKAKIIASQLHEDFCEAALRIFGPAAALGENLPGVPGRGAFEYNLRYSIMQVVGGGTIDIQRNLVARSLGFPR